MRKIFIASLLAISALLIISCASTSGTKEKQTPQTQEPVENKENKPVIPRFDDWEYRGFGKDLPDWAEAAVDLDYQTLQKSFPGKDLLIIQGFGSNPDMCESDSYQKAPYPEEAEFLDALWVRINAEYEQMDKPYISIRLFSKLTEQTNLGE